MQTIIRWVSMVVSANRQGGWGLRDRRDIGGYCARRSVLG